MIDSCKNRGNPNAANQSEDTVNRDDGRIVKTTLSIIVFGRQGYAQVEGSFPEPFDSHPVTKTLTSGKPTISLQNFLLLLNL